MNGQQLKNSILQLAIQGKLVPQDPNDEPASVLLGKIRKEKEQLVKAGKLKKKDLVSTPIADEEKPFEIPESWEWCRVFDICNFANPDKRKGKYVCLDAKFLRGKSKGNILEKGNYVEANSHIILVDGENSGEVFITPCCGYMGSTFKELMINSQPCEHYIRLFLLQLKEKLRNNKRGAAIPHLDKELFFQTLIPLPPLSEQHRIVAKIEELMPFVSEYDKAQSKLDELNDRLPSILKKSILQEAIMGKLVPQDPNDEPASVLLGKIRKEKEQLVKAGKLKKKDLVSTPIADEEKPFEIPESWEWCRVFDLCNFANPDKRKGKYVCLDAKYLRGKSQGVILEKGNYVEANSHIILVDGENSGEVFTTPCCGYMGSTFKELIINSQPCEHYIRLFLLQLKETLRNNKRGAAIPHLDKELFFQTLIPLPPLSEQHRIVSNIEELFGELNKAQI